MSFDPLLHLLANVPPESRQPLILAAAGLLLLAFLQRGRGDRAEGPRRGAAHRRAPGRELPHALIVGPPRSGKGLLAVSQLLTWEGSAIVNDLKGELFDATAGYRSRFSRIVVVDPRGFGQQFGPLASRTSEDECLAAAVACWTPATAAVMPATSSCAPRPC